MPLALNAMHSPHSIQAVAPNMSDAHFSSKVAQPAAHNMASATDLISADIEILLTQSPYRELRKMNVIVTEHEIELRGEVSTFYLKQVAQEIARKVAADRLIRNLLQVGK